MVAIVLLGSIVLMRNTKERLHQAFFALSLSATLWTLTNLIYAIVSDVQTQYAAALLSYCAAGFLALFFLLYCLGLARIHLKITQFYTIFVVGFVAAITSCIPGIVATGVTADDKIISNPLPLLLYGIYLLGYMGAGIITLVWARAHAKGVEQGRLGIVLYGLVIAAAVGLFFNLVLPVFGNYSFVKVGPVASLIFVATSTYAIVRHKLFDIKLAVVRTIAYALSLFTLGSVYYAIVYVLSVLVFSEQNTVGANAVNVTIALILAFLFQPIKRFFDQATNNIFYRESYNSEDFFARLSLLLSSTIDLRGLLERAAQEIADTLKSEQALFFVYSDSGVNHYMAAGTRGHSKLPLHDAHLLDEYVAQADSDIILTQYLVQDDKIRRLLVSHRIALAVPLMQGETVAGYLMLGDHKTSTYSKRDLTILSTLRSELAIAIQNAMSLHKVRELNATLQQRVDVATKELRSSNSQLKHLDEVKDEFMSMASHQLRTPLTSIKGYLSMVLEGDAGKISPQQEKLLLEAFNSSERMVRLISDFLNVSRLQTGKFLIEKTTFDIRDIVKQEVSELEMLAASRSLKLRLNVGKDPLPVHADADKLRQVMMNFIDNAIYYSNDKGTIVVSLERVRNEIAFTVVDSGIGVPEDEQTKLFTKFFRAKNARQQRPDGTGVGLYLARRVLNEHSGKIIFSSKEGKGSTFGFRLPLETTRPVVKTVPALEVAAK
jgi:signal transduction histidine kinase